MIRYYKYSPIIIYVYRPSTLSLLACQLLSSNPLLKRVFRIINQLFFWTTIFPSFLPSYPELSLSSSFVHKLSPNFLRLLYIENDGEDDDDDESLHVTLARAMTLTFGNTLGNRLGLMSMAHFCIIW